MVSAFILSLIALLRNGRVFPFLNSAIVLFALVFFSGQENKNSFSKSNKETIVFTDSSSHQNIPFIQPLTSLAGFSWKFGKETKKKEVKVVSMASLYLPHLFRK